MKLLPPSQQLAVLAILTHDTEAAFAFGPMPERRPLWTCLDAGPPRQLAALLAYWFATIERRGVAEIFGTPQKFRVALDFARHAASDADTRKALEGEVEYPTIRDLCSRAMKECEAVRDEGEALVWRMVDARGVPNPRRRTPSSTETANRAATLAFLNGGGADAA